MREKKIVFKLFFVWDFEKEERWLNLLCAAMLSYALGRIHGMKAALEKERSLHE